MCSETDFTQEKVNFHAITGIPNSSTYCCCPLDHHLQEAGPSFWQPQKGHEKCIFETLHNVIKCVLSVTESNFNEKKDQNFHICLRSGPRWLTPPPPFTVSLTENIRFFTPSLNFRKELDKYCTFGRLHNRPACHTKPSAIVIRLRPNCATRLCFRLVSTTQDGTHPLQCLWQALREEADEDLDG